MAHLQTAPASSSAGPISQIDPQWPTTHPLLANDCALPPVDTKLNLDPPAADTSIASQQPEGIDTAAMERIRLIAMLRSKKLSAQQQRPHSSGCEIPSYLPELESNITPANRASACQSPAADDNDDVFSASDQQSGHSSFNSSPSPRKIRDRAKSSLV